MDADELVAALERQLKPYRGELPSFPRLPEDGVPRAEVAGLVERLAAAEESRWRNGFASGAVYHGDPEHVAFLNRVYAAQSQSNPLHPDLWPSATKFEAEIVAMTADMLGARHADPAAPVAGTVSSGGTESILLAMKTYRDFARARRGIAEPEIVAPVTAHAAFDKAARYFDMTLVRVPVDAGFKADLGRDGRCHHRADRGRGGVGADVPARDHRPDTGDRRAGRRAGRRLPRGCLPRRVHRAVGREARLPGAAVRLPAARGDVDVRRHAQVRLRGEGLLGRPVPGEGTAAVPVLHDHRLARRPVPVAHVRRSRPGALSATCWAAMVSIGARGYTEAARRILETGARVRDGIAAIPGVRVLGDPLWVIAFTTGEGADVFQVLENMSGRGWSLNGLQLPPAVHIAITLRHTLPGVADRFLADLRESVEQARANPGVSTGMAPVYGMAASLPAELVHAMLAAYLDITFEV